MSASHLPASHHDPYLSAPEWSPSTSPGRAPRPIRGARRAEWAASSPRAGRARDGSHAPDRRRMTLHDPVGDRDPRPVEVAVIAQRRPCRTQRIEQAGHDRVGWAPRGSPARGCRCRVAPPCPRVTRRHRHRANHPVPWARRHSCATRRQECGSPADRAAFFFHSMARMRLSGRPGSILLPLDGKNAVLRPDAHRPDAVDLQIRSAPIRHSAAQGGDGSSLPASAGARRRRSRPCRSPPVHLHGRSRFAPRACCATRPQDVVHGSPPAAARPLHRSCAKWLPMRDAAPHRGRRHLFLARRACSPCR